MKKQAHHLLRRPRYFGKLKTWLAARTESEEQAATTAAAGGGVRQPAATPAGKGKPAQATRQPLSKAAAKHYLPKLTLDDVPHPTDDFLKN